MLLAYGGRNCWGFKNWMEVNLRVNKNVSDNIAFSDKRVVPAMCFEGANASGKTCALRVLAFIYDFCLNSFMKRQGSSIPFDSFFLNNEKSNFYLTFCLDQNFDNEYTYDTEIDRKNVYSEKLTLRNGKNKKILFERKKNNVVINTLCPKQDNIIYRDNASFISTLIQYGVKEINPFAEFFKNINCNVRYDSTFDDPMTDYAARFYHKNTKLHRRVIQQLISWDTGIKDVEILQVSNNQGENIYMSLFHHDTNSEQDKLFFSAQSNGTKLLYNRLKDIFLTLDTGGVLIFDEIDTHLHSEIVPALLNFFLDPAVNKKHAQIIFSSHSTILLDTLKKYRVYLFKKIKSESICYRIDELYGNNLLRNDRSLEQLYKSGALGGTPNVSKEEQH